MTWKRVSRIVVNSQNVGNWWAQVGQEGRRSDRPFRLYRMLFLFLFFPSNSLSLRCYIIRFLFFTFFLAFFSLFFFFSFCSLTYMYTQPTNSFFVEASRTFFAHSLIQSFQSSHLPLLSPIISARAFIPGIGLVVRENGQRQLEALVSLVSHSLLFFPVLFSYVKFKFTGETRPCVFSGPSKIPLTY